MSAARQTLPTAENLLAGSAPVGGLHWGIRVPLAALVTEHDTMAQVIAADVRSETPDAPLYLKIIDGLPGRYEIADGHHRVADALRNGVTHLYADIDSVPDDEPYQPPFFNFAAAHPSPSEVTTS